MNNSMRQQRVRGGVKLKLFSDRDYGVAEQAEWMRDFQGVCEESLRDDAITELSEEA